ncbi:MAG: hypothetical protein QOE96_2232 [Blastocatellia bacterium]|nr:hypothetical protein [Blastocatellia bacterium]
MRAPNPSVTQPLVITLAILALVLGGCRTSPRPDTKRDPSIATKAEPDSKVVADTPSVVGLIENVSMYPVPNHQQDLAVSLVVSVRNAGALSTAQGWSLEVSSPSRRVPTVVEPVHVSGYVEMPGTNGTRVDLAKEDLVQKTAQAPIAKGTRVKGILTFVLSKTSEDELSNNHTSFTVHFKDSQSNPYQTPKSVIGGKAQPGAKQLKKSTQ